MDKSAAAELLSDDSTFATIAHIIAYGTYGDDTYSMDMLELFQNLSDDYKTQMSQDVCQKLQAIVLASTTDAFFQDKEAFRAICNTLIEGDPGFMIMDDLTVIEILWSTYEVSLNHPGSEFLPGVQSLIDKELREEGVDSEEEAEEMPYYDRAMDSLTASFKKQLMKLGLDANALPPSS